MFKSMKIRTKMLFGFVSVVFLAAIIGIIAIIEIKKIDTADTKMYESVVQPFGQITKITTQMQEMRVFVRDMVLASDQEALKENYNAFMSMSVKIDSIMAVYQSTILTDAGHKTFDELVLTKKAYVDCMPEFKAMLNNGKTEEAKAFMRGEWSKVNKKMHAASEALIAQKINVGSEISDNNTAIANTATLIMIILIIISIIIALIIGNAIAGNIQSIIKMLVDQTKILSNAAVEGKLATRGDVEKVNFEFREVVIGVNEMLDAILLPIGEGNRILSLIRGGNLRERVEIACNGDHEKMKVAINGVHQWLSELIAYVTKIANGDMTAEMSKASNDDQIHQWLIMMRDRISALVTDANMLSNAAIDGKLATRADASKHQGDFKAIVLGVNQTLDAVIGPLNVAAEYIDRISKGDIPSKITDNYNGDFNEIKTNINILIESTNKQAEAAQAVADGDLTVQIEIRSEKDVLAKSLVNVIKVLQGLQKEMARLTDASNEGLLSERGNPKQFKGAYAEVVIGVNEMLDAILLPIGEGNRILSMIRGGNLKERVEIACKGDHETMTEAINDVINALSLLVSDG